MNSSVLQLIKQTVCVNLACATLNRLRRAKWPTRPSLVRALLIRPMDAPAAHKSLADHVAAVGVGRPPSPVFPSAAELFGDSRNMRRATTSSAIGDNIEPIISPVNPGDDTSVTVSHSGGARNSFAPLPTADNSNVVSTTASASTLTDAVNSSAPPPPENAPSAPPPPAANVGPETEHNASDGYVLVLMSSLRETAAAISELEADLTRVRSERCVSAHPYYTPIVAAVCCAVCCEHMCVDTPPPLLQRLR